MFYKLKKKSPINGVDEKGEPLVIDIIKGEEVSPETFTELTNGKGDDDVE